MSKHVIETRSLGALINLVRGELRTAGFSLTELSHALSRIDLSNLKVFVFTFGDLGRERAGRVDVEKVR